MLLINFENLNTASHAKKLSWSVCRAVKHWTASSTWSYVAAYTWEYAQKPSGKNILKKNVLPLGEGKEKSEKEHSACKAGGGREGRGWKAR